MKERYFVNIAFDDAIKSYLSSANEPEGVLYNSFMVVTIRVLSLIYGKLDVLNPYYLRNKVAFFENLAKYGMNVSDIALFVEEFLQFYQFEKENETRNIRLKNPHFLPVSKYLVDMFVWKKKLEEVSDIEEETFLELMYTTHTKNIYRISLGYFMGDAKYIEKYYYSKLNEMEMTREYELNKTIHTSLNLDALNVLGISLSNLKDMSLEDIKKAKKDAYDYFEVDANDINREIDLQNKVNYYKMYGRKVTTGNGYVDILLLMSVIVTTISVAFILILSVV